MAKAPARAISAKRLEQMDDESLLAQRICDLNVTLKGSPIESRVERFYEELDARGIDFKPTCYLSTEWLCPDKIPTIGIPFCLAHPRLHQLEQTMMLEVEGSSEKQFMKLIRHEAGHAFNYAYKFYKRNRWRELFGLFSQEYDVQEYYPRPYSKQYVEHLPDNYAQAHPDEDFAETFAVWLTPGKDWRKRYKGWPALKKLEYVDHLMKEVGSKPPVVAGGPKMWPIRSVRSTLANYYKKKRVEFGATYPGYFDKDLYALFTHSDDTDLELAHVFLKRNQRALTNMIAKWANVRKYGINDLLKRMIRRARDLKLRLATSEEETLLFVATRVTAIVVEDRFRSQLVETTEEEDE